jgi:hypothetical protein
VGGVVGDVEGAVQQLAQFLGRRRRVYVIDRVGGFGGGHVVRLRAHAADAVGEQRHLLHRPAHGEPLEPAQLRDLEVRIGDVALLVQEDLDLAVSFQPGDRINASCIVPSTSLCTNARAEGFNFLAGRNADRKTWRDG